MNSQAPGVRDWMWFGCWEHSSAGLRASGGWWWWPLLVDLLVERLLGRRTLWQASVVRFQRSENKRSSCPPSQLLGGSDELGAGRGAVRNTGIRWNVWPRWAEWPEDMPRAVRTFLGRRTRCPRGDEAPWPVPAGSLPRAGCEYPVCAHVEKSCFCRKSRKAAPWEQGLALPSPPSARVLQLLWQSPTDEWLISGYAFLIISIQLFFFPKWFFWRGGKSGIWNF